MSVIFLMLLLLAAGVILVHCLCVISNLSHRKWSGHKGRFAGVTFSVALLAGGAAGMVLDYPPAPVLLIVGIAGAYIFERRGSC